MHRLILLLFPVLVWGQAKPISPSTTQQRNHTVPVNNCSDVFYIYSGNYNTFNFFMGRNYENNMNCVLIFRGHPGRRLFLQLFDVEVQPGVFDCEYDNIQIYSNYRGEIAFIDKFCGTLQQSPVLITEGNIAIVTFYSDNELVGRGFSLHVQLETSHSTPSYPSPTHSSPYPYPTPSYPYPTQSSPYPYPTPSYPYPTPSPTSPSYPPSSYYDCNSYPWTTNGQGAWHGSSSSDWNNNHGSSYYNPPNSGYGIGSSYSPESYGYSSHGYDSNQRTLYKPPYNYRYGEGSSYKPSSAYAPSYGSGQISPYDKSYYDYSNEHGSSRNTHSALKNDENTPYYNRAKALPSSFSFEAFDKDILNTIPPGYFRKKRAGINCKPVYGSWNAQNNFQSVKFQPIAFSSERRNISQLPVGIPKAFDYAQRRYFYHGSPQSKKIHPIVFKHSNNKKL